MNELIKKIKSNTNNIRAGLDEEYSLYVDNLIEKEDYIVMYDYYMDKLMELSSLTHSLATCDIIDLSQWNELISYIDNQFNNCLNLYTVG